MMKKIVDKKGDILFKVILFIAWMGYAIKEDLKKNK